MLVCREAGLLALTEESKIEECTASEIFVRSDHLYTALMGVKHRGKKQLFN